MAASTIPIKTPLGQAELATRRRSVSQRHRTVLFLIDGKRNATEVRSMALQAGVTETCFDELLELGMIMLPERLPELTIYGPAPQAPLPPLEVDLPLPVPESGAGPASASSAPRGEMSKVAAEPHSPTSAAATPDSILPPSRTLYPESASGDSLLAEIPVPDSWLPSEAGGLATTDPALHEARLVLLRAVRAESPLAGSLTLMRLRRARTRAEIVALLDEVEARITKPHRALAAAQTMRRVRELLDGRRLDSTLASA